MTASSGTVLANLAYLIGAVVVAVIAGVAIWLRHRQPKSVDATVASFRRGLSALAPESDVPRRARPPAGPAGPGHVRVGPEARPGRRAPGADAGRAPGDQSG